MATDPIPAANADVLAAQAQSGMQGVQAYQQAQQSLQQQKAAAVQQAMQEAALRGAPAGAAQSQQGIITQPYDDRIASLTQNQAAYQADMAARDTRYSQYQGAVNEARTLIPGEVEMRVAPIRAQGEATIANTLAQGRAQVDQINAQTQLALAKMQADAAAAARAAAAKKAAANKLTGTDLQAMMSQGTAGIMQKSLGNLGGMITENEKAAAAAAASKTKSNPNVYVLSTGAAAAPKLKQAQVISGQGAPAQSPYGQTYSLPTGATARPGGATAYTMGQTGPSYTLPTGATATGKLGNAYSQTQPAPGPSPALQEALRQISQQTRSTLSSMQAPAPASRSRMDMQQWMSNQYGSISLPQVQALQQSDPYLAGLIGGSPEPLSSGNVGRVVFGTPDQYNQPSQYSQDAVSAAQQYALKKLVDAGYDISPQDLANATTADMKPGESFAQYMGRVSGQASTADKTSTDWTNLQHQWAIDEHNRQTGLNTLTDPQKIGEANQYQATHDQYGNPIYDPNTGLPATASPADKTKAQDALDEQTAEQDVLTVLPYLPSKSQYGDARQVQRTVIGDGTKDSNGVPAFVALYQLLAAQPGAATGMSADQFNSALNATAPIKNFWKNMNAAQKDLLRQYLFTPQNYSKPNG